MVYSNKVILTFVLSISLLYDPKSLQSAPCANATSLSWQADRPFAIGANCLYMIGQGNKYDYLNDNHIYFPRQLNPKTDKIFRSEREFIEFIIRNDWIQRRLGIKVTGKVSGLFPDIKGEINDSQGGNIRVEVEYLAENYGAHNHLWGGCDLILSFIRKPFSRIVRGCPVWSFYYEQDGVLYYCLDDDIAFNFNTFEIDDGLS